MSSLYKVGLLICGRYITSNQEIYRLVWNIMVMQKPNQLFEKLPCYPVLLLAFLQGLISRNLDYWEFTTIAIWIIKNIKWINLPVKYLISNILRFLRLFSKLPISSQNQQASAEIFELYKSRTLRGIVTKIHCNLNLCWLSISSVTVTNITRISLSKVG